MMTLRALISTFARLEDELADDHLKLCCLWYDEVLVEDLIPQETISSLCDRVLKGQRLDNADRKALTDILRPLSTRLSQKQLGEIRQIGASASFPRWTDAGGLVRYDFPEPERAAEHAHNLVLNELQMRKSVQFFRGIEVLYAEGQAAAAVQSVELWLRLRGELNCMLQATGLEKIALAAAHQYRTGQATALPASVELFKLAVPSFQNVPWSDVMRLKKTGSFMSVRDKLAEVLGNASFDLPSARKNLQQLQTQANEEIIDQYRPKFKNVLAEKLWASIPTAPFPNPFNAMQHVHEVLHEKQKEQSFGWHYLLRDVQNTTALKDSRAEQR